jgi:hypothetical protein
MGRNVISTWTQESQVHIHSVRAEHEASKMARVDQRL